MIWPWLIVPIVAVAVYVLIRAVLREDDRTIYWIKPTATLLVMAVALTAIAQPDTSRSYMWAILVGLLFSLGGDVALMFTSDQAFLAGVGSFLLAQIVYGRTFAAWGGLEGQLLVPGIIIGLVIIVFYGWLYRHLGSMRMPVGVYAAVISFMLWMAIGLLSVSAFPNVAGWLVASGALLFYLSDMILAINKFAKPFPSARALNLTAYYAGQTLIALSTSYVLATM